MKKAPKLTDAERLEIGILLNKDHSLRSIAAVLGRSPNTISDEARRNSVRTGYKPVSAQVKALARRKFASYQGRKIQESLDLRWYIIVRLQAHWNPDEIAGAMKRERQAFYVSKTTIYEWLRSEWGQYYCWYLDSRRYNARKRKPKAARPMIPDRVSIAERPLGATNRSRYGHWEGDTVVSGKRTGSTAALVVTVERKTRLVAARTIPNLKPESFNGAIWDVQAGVTEMLSLSLDNGIENRWHSQLDVPTYFCDPYSSWQKGSVENANRMIRRYLPKGMDLATVTPTRLQDIIWIINNKPRKILGYKSATQMAKEKGVLRERVS
jgi:transposase, IS30 family